MRVYVTGGTGLIGSNIAKLYADWYNIDVVVTAGHGDGGPQAGRLLHVDLHDASAVRTSILHERPDVIVHAAGPSPTDQLYSERDLARSRYIHTVKTIVECANTIGATVVFISNDWVFDGTQHGAHEDTTPTPINFYGQLTRAAEILVLELATAPIVARLSGVWGIHWARPEATFEQGVGFADLPTAIVDSLSIGELFTVWEGDTISQRATPSLVTESAEMLLRLVEGASRGIFHCCGGESASRIELAYVTAEVFDLDTMLLRSGRPGSTLLSEPVPFDSSIVGYRTAEEIDYEVPTLRELLIEFRRQRETGLVRPLGAAALRG